MATKPLSDRQKKIVRELISEHYATDRYTEISAMAKKRGITVTPSRIKGIAKQMRDEGDGPRGARYVEAELIKAYIRENTHKTALEITEGLRVEHGLIRSYLSIGYLARQLGLTIERIENGGRKKAANGEPKRDRKYVAPVSVRPDMPAQWGWATREICTANARRVSGLMGSMERERNG